MVWPTKPSDIYRPKDKPLAIGRDIILFSKQKLHDKSIRTFVEDLEVARERNGLQFFAPNCQGALDAINDHTSNVCVFRGGNQRGKCQPLETPIETPLGQRKLGDLKVGDEVFGKDGKPTKITGVFQQGKKKVYRLTFDKGEVSTLACGEHLWFYLRHKRAFEKTRPNYLEYEVLSTEEISDRS